MADLLTKRFEAHATITGEMLQYIKTEDDIEKTIRLQLDVLIESLKEEFEKTYAVEARRILKEQING